MNELSIEFEKLIKKVDVYINSQEIVHNATSSIWDMHHYFLDGLYIREGTLPAGMLVYGKIHRFTHPVFLMYGRVLVATQNGVTEHSAPCMIICEGGSPKIVYAIEKSKWINVHATDKKTPEDAEEELTFSSFEEQRKCG